MVHFFLVFFLLTSKHNKTLSTQKYHALSVFLKKITLFSCARCSIDLCTLSFQRDISFNSFWWLSLRQNSGSVSQKYFSRHERNSSEWLCGLEVGCCEAFAQSSVIVVDPIPHFERILLFSWKPFIHSMLLCGAEHNSRWHPFPPQQWITLKKPSERVAGEEVLCWTMEGCWVAYSIAY